MQPVIISIMGLALALGGLLMVVFALRSSTEDEERVRLREFVTEHALESQRDLNLTFRRSELAGSFGTRVIVPWFKGLARVFGRFTPAQAVSGMRQQLTLAGNPYGLGPREFYGLRVVCLAAGLAVAFFLLRASFNPSAAPSATTSTLTEGDVQPALSARQAVNPEVAAPRLNLGPFAGAALAVYLGLYMPRIWLRRRVRARQTNILKSLPDALDMLSVCAEAGLGFDQAVQRVSERWNTPLGQEFGRYVAEMQMGLSRERALRNLADRTKVLELSSFVAVINQSDKMGMSITQTLNSHAQQMRIERRHRAQEEARKAPLKMLFPMLLLVFPAMFAVILGPSLPVFAEFFRAINSTAGSAP